MSSRALFATYHADQPDGSSAHPSTSGHNYHELAALALRSAALFHSDCGLTLLTDNETPWAGLGPEVELRRVRPSVDRFNLARFEAEIDFVRTAPPARLVVLMDTDVLVNASLIDLVDPSWDVALTYREDDEYPINKGVILVNGERRDVAVQFLERVRRSYELDEAADSAWWGDQRALIETLGREAFRDRRDDTLDVAGVTVRLLPCETYNFSPDEDGRSLARALSDKRIIHFKGARKTWMRPYWRAHLAAVESATPASIAAGVLWRSRLALRSRQGSRR